MSKLGDFFRMLASNPNIIDDKETNEELEKFLEDNRSSLERVRAFEKSILADETTKSKLNVVAKGKSKATSKSDSKAISNDKEDKEIEM